MAEEELQMSPWYWRWVEYAWGYTGTLAVVAVLGGTLGRGVMQWLHLHEQPANLVCCVGLYNPAGPRPPEPLGVRGQGMKPDVAHVRVLKNAAGQTISAEYVDAAGRSSNMPGSRVARQSVEYDDHGRVTKRINRDAGGRLAADAAGVAVREFAYDEAGRLVRTAYRGENGRTIEARPSGVAEQRVAYDAQGRPLTVRNMGANGMPTEDSRGEETLSYEYDDAAGVEWRRNQVREQVSPNHAGYAMQRITRDAEGRELRREWFDAEGRPVRNAHAGASVVVHEHYPQSRMKRSLRVGADGAVDGGEARWSEHVVRHDAQGRPEWECFAGKDGLPCDNEALGYAERVSTYTPAGEKDREFFWEADGTPAACAEKRYARSPDGQSYCLSLHADGSSTVAPVADTVNRR